MSFQETEKLRDRVEELERLLGMKEIPPRVFGLTRRETEMFGILMKRRIVSQRQFFDAIWSGDSDVNDKITEVYICKLRKKLRSHGIEIKNEYGIGYYLTEETKKRARERLR